MYHLVSKYGNVHKETKDARKRDTLLRMGYVEVAGASPRPTAKPKGKAATKAAAKEVEA